MTSSSYDVSARQSRTEYCRESRLLQTSMRWRQMLPRTYHWSEVRNVQCNLTDCEETSCSVRRPHSSSLYVAVRICCQFCHSTDVTLQLPFANIWCLKNVPFYFWTTPAKMNQLHNSEFFPWCETCHSRHICQIKERSLIHSTYTEGVYNFKKGHVTKTTPDDVWKRLDSFCPTRTRAPVFWWRSTISWSSMRDTITTTK